MYHHFYFPDFATWQQKRSTIMVENLSGGMDYIEVFAVVEGENFWKETNNEGEVIITEYPGYLVNIATENPIPDNLKSFMVEPPENPKLGVWAQIMPPGPPPEPEEPRVEPPIPEPTD